MSTIASPRDPSAPFPRRMNSSQTVTTPTSSSRPSLDAPLSAAGSPNAGTPTAGKRNNRAALREYYNIRKTSPAPTPPTLEVTDYPPDPNNNNGGDGSPPSPLPSELDSPGLDAPAFAARALATGGLAEVLALQARVLGEMRALGAERKALVYDNYSRLISATETIRRMRAGMDPLDPVAATLDPAVARVCELASGARGLVRGQGEGADGEEEEERWRRKRRTRELAVEVLGVPERLRGLVAEGRVEEARREWEMPRRLLETWKEKGFGGEDVDVCIREGDAALRGDEAFRDDEGDSTE